jgi:hypothetical protein
VCKILELKYAYSFKYSYQNLKKTYITFSVKVIDDEFLKRPGSLSVARGKKYVKQASRAKVKQARVYLGYTIKQYFYYLGPWETY